MNVRIGVIDGVERDVPIVEKRNIHFDVNHFNFVVWRDEEELYSKLLNRIGATI